MNPFPVFLGVDVGKKRDRAAWVGVVPKKLGAADLPVWAVVVCEQAPVGTPYAAVSARTRDLARAFAGGGWPVLVAVDATGIGAAVVEDLRTRAAQEEILGITAHSGAKIGGEWPDLRVPKTTLVGALDQALRRQALSVTAALPAADVLKAQLKTYVAKINPEGNGGRGHVRYEAARERDHDDAVSAAQLAVYAGSYWYEICRQRTPGRD